MFVLEVLGDNIFRTIIELFQRELWGNYSVANENYSNLAVPIKIAWQ
jgi:hypothetical protein